MAQHILQSDSPGPKAVIYLDCGRLRADKLISVGSRNCKTETEEGVRRKLALNKKLLIVPLEQAKPTVDKANRIAGELDMAEAWRAAAERMLPAEELAILVFPSADRHCALLALHVAHARERGFFTLDNDSWIPVAEERFRAVTASIARRQEQRQREQEWEQELDAGSLPEQLRQWLQAYLRGQPPANSQEGQFIGGYSKKRGVELGQLLVDHQMVDDIEQFHLRESLAKLNSETESQEPMPAVSADLPEHSAKAFSIDASGTEEVDDAFSVDGNGDAAMIGIHIAVPGLGLNDASEAQARERMVSVYLASRKFLMLPAAACRHYSLDAGRMRPCMSLLIGYDPRHKRIISERFQLGQITTAANLTLESFADRGLSSSEADERINRDLEVLKAFAAHLPGGLRERERQSFQVVVREGVSRVYRRARYAAVDALIETLMRYYNTQAAVYLQRNGVSCLLRDKGRLLVDTGSQKYSYGWFTSPLRRITDLYNQQQMMAQLADKPPPHRPSELRRLIPEFDRRHNWARTQQHRMEAYWSLRWLAEHKEQPLGGTVVSTSKVQLHDAPVTVRVSNTDLVEGDTAMVRCERIDLYRLEAHATVVR